MNSDQIPLHGRVDVRPLFEGEWWWTVRQIDGTLFDFGYDTDLKGANKTAKEAAQRLSRELGYI